MIGIFDSGVGGLTVLRELLRLLPSESYAYFADNAHCPYGTKSPREIIQLAEKITQFLIRKGSELVVVACNTATAAAIEHLRRNFNIPFIGMEPAIKPAALGTRTGSVGVLATAGTFNGKLYRETSKKYAAHVNVCYQVGEGLVELVEQGKATSPEAQALLEKYLQPMLAANIDHLVLGCTHYPFFTPILKRVLPEGISVIDPASAVALQAKSVLEQIGKTENSREPSIHFFASKSTEVIQNLVELQIEEAAPFHRVYHGNVMI